MSDKSALTPREQEILGFILDGLSLKEIASKLGVSYKGIEYHKGNLYRKCGIQSMQELLLLFANKESPVPNSNLPDVFARLVLFKDNLGSSISVTVEEEKFQKNTFTCYYIKGKLFDELGVYAGIHLYPDSATLESMKISSSFSFNILGDGNTYEVMLTTSDSKKQEEENHFRKIFNTERNKPSIITVNVNELSQSPIFGQKVPFIQSNVEGIQFQALSKGTFELKIWDIRFYS